MSIKTAKYRPVLTAPQILHLLNLAKLESPLSEVGVMCISTLSVFKTKIENRGVQPAYTQKPRASTLENLGGTSMALQGTYIYSKEELWEQAYNKYNQDPTTCSLQEIQDAREHMYLNDLMNASEVVDFERSQIVEQHNREDKI